VSAHWVSAGNLFAHSQKALHMTDGPDTLTPTIIELTTGLWMVKHQGADLGEEVGVIRGYITAVEVAGEQRYCARLPHLNPRQGVRLGEFWEWDRAVEAILAEQPREYAPDPYRDLKRTKPGENAQRLEQARRRRRLAGRFVE
jgi:hypothetical protein